MNRLRERSSLCRSLRLPSDSGRLLSPNVDKSNLPACLPSAAWMRASAISSGDSGSRFDDFMESVDSPEHTQRVRALADRLRSDGIEAWIDQYVQDPDEGWIRWMRSQVQHADRVLLVFTETYQRRFEGDEERGKGLGATFEGVIVTQALYESGGRNAKFRPVILREGDERFIPLELRRFNRYIVDTRKNYEALLRWLYEAPLIVAPIVGVKPHLPPKPASELFPSTPAQTSATEPTDDEATSVHRFGKKDPHALEWRWFTLGSVLFLVAVALVIWGLSLGTLTEDQRRLLMWALPLASGFAAGLFAASLSAQARNWIPATFITGSGGFAIWLITFLFLFPESKVVKESPKQPPTATPSPIPKIPAMAPVDSLIVPDEYPTIQAAIDAAKSGDTVFVKAGHYHEAIKFKNGITLHGECKGYHCHLYANGSTHCT